MLRISFGGDSRPNAYENKRILCLAQLPHPPTTPLAITLKCPCFPHLLLCLYLRSLSPMEPAAGTPIWFPSLHPWYLYLVDLLEALSLSRIRSEAPTGSQ